MLKSTITKATYEEIYRRWDEVTPAAFDCGKICGAACCHANDRNGPDERLGIYLLPGEEKQHDRHDGYFTWSWDDAADYDFPESWQGKVAFLDCNDPDHCHRKERPIQCRTFPLKPQLSGDGELTLIYDDTDLPYVCPLIEQEAELEEEFRRVTYENWEILVQDPLIRDLVLMDSKT